jgi:hypothetical protein
MAKEMACESGEKMEYRKSAPKKKATKKKKRY